METIPAVDHAIEFVGEGWHWMSRGRICFQIFECPPYPRMEQSVECCYKSMETLDV